MGDQKDHVTIQKKETESASHEVETQNFETATESLPPPAFQLKSEPSQEKEDKEGFGKEGEPEGAFQFSLASPPDKPDNNASKTLNAEPVQKKGFAEPFKIPTIQKKDATLKADQTNKPSFKL